MSASLHALGFSAFFEQQVAALAPTTLVPARIVTDSHGVYRLAGCAAELGELSGELRARTRGAQRATTGDWVLVADVDPAVGGRATVVQVLERRTAMIRRAAGRRGQAQIVAANVDVVCVVTSPGRDFNVRRIERYLTTIHDSGATPVVVINKADLVDDAAPFVAQVSSVALDVPVVMLSALSGDGFDLLRDCFRSDQTVGFVGSSGVGKSSIVNRLLGHSLQDVSELRRDGKGRHTTTGRHLVVLEEGGVLIDTPGMRELGLLEDEGGIDATFAEITAFASGCRFADCVHETEPHCAVRAAVAEGQLAPDRLESYQRQRRELAAESGRQDPVVGNNTKRRWKTIHKSIRQHYRTSGKRSR